MLATRCTLRAVGLATITFLLSLATPVTPMLSGAPAPGLLGAHSRVVVCYVSSWAAYRPGRGEFKLDDLDPRLCTHLVYAFAGLNVTSGALRSLDPYRDLTEEYGLGWYGKLTGLKSRYPHLKVTLAVGGWNEGSANYSKMAGDRTLRKAFVESAVKILEKHGFDGLDLDWEFPASRGGAAEDKANFVTLVKELRGALSPRGLIVTAALGAGRSTIEAAYDVAALGSLLDLMHVMCYDYHGAWDSRTGPNAPLATADSHDPLSVTATIKYLKQLGAPAHKLVLGVPMYGRTFLLSGSERSHPFGSSALNKGFQGPFTREDGFMGYNEICLELNAANSTWVKGWDASSKTPFAENGERYLSYDDEKSVSEKARFAVHEGLAGVMVWAIDTDDFRGDCGKGESARQHYPLVNALNTAMVLAKDEGHAEGGDVHEHNEVHASGAQVPQATSTIVLALLASVFCYL